MTVSEPGWAGSRIQGATLALWILAGAGTLAVLTGAASAQEEGHGWLTSRQDTRLIAVTYQQSLKERCRVEKVGWPPSNVRLVIEKSRHMLTLLSGDIPLKRYPVGLGLNPVSDKVLQGDSCTPEGCFHVCRIIPHSQFYRAFLIDYPTREDADRGLRDGLITKSQHTMICRALKAGLTPPQDTPLGGRIEIHGRGVSRDWTLGCIAMEDRDLEEIWNLVSIGTPVQILH